MSWNSFKFVNINDIMKFSITNDLTYFFNNNLEGLNFSI